MYRFDAIIMAFTTKAVKVGVVDLDEEEVWLPTSVVDVVGDKSITDYDPGDLVSLAVPYWLAKDRGIV